MQQIYSRTLMPMFDFNKVAKQLYWNHISTWVSSCRFTTYFSEHLFLRTPLNGCFRSSFSLLEGKRYSVFFFFFYASKSFMFRRCFSLELYACSLNISKTWFTMGSSWFVASLQSQSKAVCGVSASRTKLFSKKNC